MGVFLWNFLLLFSVYGYFYRRYVSYVFLLLLNHSLPLFALCGKWKFYRHFRKVAFHERIYFANSVYKMCSHRIISKWQFVSLQIHTFNSSTVIGKGSLSKQNKGCKSQSTVKQQTYIDSRVIKKGSKSEKGGQLKQSRSPWQRGG
jgi:hypothetical protein